MNRAIFAPLFFVLAACASSTPTVSSAPFILDPIPLFTDPPLTHAISPSLYYLDFLSVGAAARTITLASLDAFTVTEMDAPSKPPCGMGKGAIVALSPFRQVTPASYTVTITPIANGSCNLLFYGTSASGTSSTYTTIQVGPLSPT